MNATARNRVTIRSDPSMLPLGAKAKASVYPTAPSLQSESSMSSSSSDKKEAGKSRKGGGGGSSGGESVAELIFAELHHLFPVLRPLLNFLRGRYSVEAKPSAPPSSPVSFTWSIACCSVAWMARQVIAQLPLLPAEYKQSMLAVGYLSFLDTALGPYLLFGVGFLLGVFTRNRFNMTEWLSLAILGLSWAINVLSGHKEMILGVWLGTYLELVIVFKERQRKKEVPKALSTGLRPAEWLHERWVDKGTWEMQVDGRGWVTLPPHVQAELETAHGREDTQAVSVEVGESSYTVDLLQGIARNTTTGTERRTRRVVG